MSLDKPVEGGHLHHWVTAFIMSSLPSLYILVRSWPLEEDVWEQHPTG